MRRMFGVLVTVLMAVGIASAPQTAAAAPAATVCSNSWHYIKASQVGRNVKPEGGWLRASGGSDLWNQQFTFCRDPLWGANHYGIYSNATGRYCDGVNTSGIVCSLSNIPDVYALFEVKKYDAKFWTIEAVGRDAYVYTDASGWLRLDRGQFLGGDNLFEISPTNLMG